MNSFIFNIFGCQMNGITPRYRSGCRVNAILYFKKYQDFTSETRTSCLMWLAPFEQQVPRCLNPPKVVMNSFIFNIFGCQMNGITPRYCTGCHGDWILCNLRSALTEFWPSSPFFVKQEPRAFFRILDRQGHRRLHWKLGKWGSVHRMKKDIKLPY